MVKKKNFWKNNFSLYFFNIILFLIYFFVFQVNISNAKSIMLMITDEACPYCQAWEREVGHVYPKTDFSKEFKLVRMPIDVSMSDFGDNVDPALGTPTFIFIRDRVEIGRIEGFSDVEMFWWLISDIAYPLKVSGD